MMDKILRTSFISLLAVGCAHSVHEVHVSDFTPVPIAAGRLIHASTEQEVVLWFTDNTDYVDQAKVALMNQCSGEIVGITTQYSTALGFLSWKNKILMQGVCLKAL